MYYLRKKRDFYTKKAKREGYRSRAAYKLLQIDKKFRIFLGNQVVIDLCGAPGGFSQIARDQTSGRAKIFLIDLARVKPIPHITKIIKGDITKLETVIELKQAIIEKSPSIKEIIVLADCSPNVSGHWATDHARQIWLTEVALGISNYFLANKFVTKVFQGDYFKDLLQKIKNSYEEVNVFKPPTSRSKSAEVYVIGNKRKYKNLERYDQSHLIIDDI